MELIYNVDGGFDNEVLCVDIKMRGLCVIKSMYQKRRKISFNRGAPTV